MSKFKRNIKEYFSLVIIPTSHAKPISINIPIRLIKWSFFVFVVVGVFAVISLSFSIRTSLKLTEYEKLKSEKVHGNKQLLEYTEEIDRIQKDLVSLSIKEQQIKKMLGQSSKKKQKNEAADSEKKYQKLIAQLKSNPDYVDADKLTRIFEKKTSFIKKELYKRKSSYIDLYSTVKKEQTRFAFTPSIWPVHGPIRSGFGLRAHPREFHRGLDIGGSIGTPIKAAANGRVKFAGWYSGYGLTIIIDHGHGYQTLYAHLSRINVKKGQMVQKENRIGALGSTGFTTGPHLHYEVHQFGVAIQPNKFLKLDMFTAANNIW
ncbi:MAG: M23 family metallopeptidase [Candidatus Margulisiibacteriota bacterium]|jgi:murein DD-endopeptidase MepM/ murein hydrolase activator NlpD